MGTKNNPSKYDCYEKAEPDEPVFVLIGRDPAAALLVRLWASMHAGMEDTKPEKLEEARECVRAFEAWASEHIKDEDVHAAETTWDEIATEWTM